MSVPPRSEPAPATDPWHQIAWAEPAFAELTWDWDDMHAPRALHRLSQSYLELLNAGMNVRPRALGLPVRTVLMIVNGYAYFAFSVDAPADERAAVLERAAQARKAEIAVVGDWWRDVAKPEAQAIYRELEGLPVAGTGPEGLAAAWDRAWQMADRIWEIHFRVIVGAYEALDDLVDVVKARLDDIADADVLGLASGEIRELAAVEAGLEDLAALLAAHPDLAERLRTAAPASIAELRGLPLPGAATFAAAVDEFLGAHGHLGHLTEDLGEPSWNETPGRLLADLAIRTERDDRTPGHRRALREAAAAELESRIRMALAGRPDDLATFERALAAARAVGWLTEGHNYWLDRMCGDRLRRFTRRIGAHLVAAGAIDDADDICHFTRDEVGPLLRAPADQRALVAERKAEHAWRSALTPPPRTLGKAKDPDDADRFDGARFASTDAAVVRGTGASAGVVRSVARVVHGPDDFDRVRPGDIVVARASNPGWVPLFSIAGGFVTDTGGVLSHAAVVAREFGVPAVVGTGDATSRITDGQIVELDGATGYVRLG